MGPSITRYLALLALSLCTGFDAHSEINFSGFATVVAGQTSDENERFLGYDDDFSVSAGSLFAIQANSDLGNGVSAVIQVMARGDDDWDPDFTWAYLSYNVSDEWRLLFGRQRAPLYLYSDYLDVSYAYHWLRPPAAVYDAPFDTFDGIGSIYSTLLGESFVTLHMVYGVNDDKDTPINDTELDTKFSDLFGGSLTWNYDWLTMRGAYFRATADIPIDQAPPTSALTQLNALRLGWSASPFPMIADEIAILDDTIGFAQLGAQVDYNDWILVAEYTSLDLSETIFPDQESWYLSVGKRFDDKVFHATYGVNKDDSEFLVAKYNVPTNTGTSLDLLTIGTDAAQQLLDVDEPFYTLGMRWDFHDSVALKIEFTHTEDDAVNTDVSLFQIGLVSVF